MAYVEWRLQGNNWYEIANSRRDAMKKKKLLAPSKLLRIIRW